MTTGKGRPADELRRQRERGIKMDVEGKRAPFEIRGDDWYNKPLDYQVIIYEPNHETHVAKITMNRPEAMNSLSHQLRAELFHALKVAEKDTDINVIIIKGRGRCFSAGYDLVAANIGVNEPDFGGQYVGDAHWPRYLINQYWQIWDLNKIVIAQTHGYVLAGGSELCFACDLLVTTPDCQFGYPPVRAMGTPDLMWFPWLLPMRKAKEMAFSGDSITGQQAFEYGMANYVVPQSEIDEFTETFAKRMAITPWQVTSLYKRSIQKAYEIMGIRQALEANVPFYSLSRETDWMKGFTELMSRVPLREYLTIRDGPYRDYRTQEEAILSRAQREGEAWKKVSEEAKGKISENVAEVNKMKSKSKKK
ncbi:MAG: enoyl-CoA hydratase/isomerase family protein [Chloroflexi bacterium]|nr:enoyl-CoA hydratase/isomerase family protein [Chloroflexota bacterium]